MRLVMEKEHWLDREGAAALAVAAAFSCTEAAKYQGKKVAVVLCGRNLSPEVMRRIS